MNRLSGENLIGMVPRPVLSALQALENAGYEAFMVGGCVRDMAMGQKPSDWDIATSAQPEQIKVVFSKEKTVDTGIKHGTVTVISENLAMEITTYRTEGTYSDHRHPDVVEYTQDAALDLARRDFTINAMALDRQGRLTDLSGGLDDICRRMVRCVGDPQKRFEEDALRIMRALRFSSRLDFDIERETLAAARSCGHLLRQVSPERLRDELTGILCGHRAGRLIYEEAELMANVIPELLPCKGFDQKNSHHIYDVLGHIAAAIDSIRAAAGSTEHVAHEDEEQAKKILCLAALFHDIGKPRCFTVDDEGTGHFYDHARISAEMAEKIMTRLHFDRNTIEKVTALVRYHGINIEPEPKYVKRALNKYSPEMFFSILALKRADNMAQSPDFRSRQETYDRLEKIAGQIIEEEQCFSLRDLEVNGKDLIQAGMEQGPEIGKTLEALLAAVMDGKVANEKKALLEEAKNIPCQQNKKTVQTAENY